MNLKGLKINFLGDSITQGIGTSCDENVYHAILKREAELSEARNYGIGGTRFALQKDTDLREWDEYVDTNSFCERFHEMNDDADVVVVFGGTNDYGHGQAALGSIDNLDMHTFYGALHTLIKGLINDYVDKQIVFMTPLHRHNEYGQGTWKPDGVEQRPLCDYVKAVKDVCEYYSVPVLDLYSCGELCGNTPVWYKEYMPDGLHPNDKGHEIIACKLGKFLENL
jgi:lysophospholipase L1-like esterase